MDCPFSADRLRELHVLDRWTEAQIATLAGAITAEPVETETVLAWLRAAGLSTPHEARPRPVQPRAALPRPRGGPPRLPRLAFPCEECGRQVTRTQSETRGHVFCSRHCAFAWQAGHAHARRQVRRESPRVQGEKPCAMCQEVKPLPAYSVDVSRGDGRARICLTCNAMKARAYYIANQERLRARALARKHRLRAEREQGGGK